MLLSNNKNTFNVPHTSTCIIHTQGVIKDGSIVSVTSPIFASTNFTSRSINMSDRFNVPVRISNKSEYIINNGELKATLICNDNDVFSMFVIIE